MLAAFLGLALAVTGARAHPCRAALPRGPAVPAAIVLRTSCGAFRLAPDGRVALLPRHWLARHGGGTGRRYGADLAIRRTRAGRVVLLRRGRVVWRSSALYRNDVTDVAFGPHELAFSSYRRGVFLTDLNGPERLVARGRGLYPYDFLRGGELLVTGSGGLSVLARDGTRLRRYRYRRRNGFAFDGRTETLFFVTRGGRLATAHGARMRLGPPLRGIDGYLGFDRAGVLVFYGGHGVTVTRLDGSPLARAGWPRSRRFVFDSGLSVSPDARTFAFRLRSGRAGARTGAAALYLFRAGDTRAHAIFRHRLRTIGCAAGAGLSWHGRFLLYSSSDGRLAVADSRSGAIRGLGPLARALPRLARREVVSAYWASDFRGSPG